MNADTLPLFFSVNTSKTANTTTPTITLITTTTAADSGFSENTLLIKARHPMNNILPEVCVECCAEADYYEGTDNIEGTPTFTDRLLEV